MEPSRLALLPGENGNETSTLEISSDHIKNECFETIEARAKQQTLDRFASMAEYGVVLCPLQPDLRNAH